MGSEQSVAQGDEAWLTATQAKPRVRSQKKFHIYTDTNGTKTFRKLRQEKFEGDERIEKSFVWERKTPEGWLRGLDGLKPGLYRQDLLAQIPALYVHLTEGEKDADRLINLDFIATTPGTTIGAADLELLRGRHVYVHEDNDTQGRGKAEDAARALHGIAASVRVVRYPDAGDSGDVSDWLDEGHTSKDLLARCKKAPYWTPDSKGGDIAERQGADRKALSIIFGIPSGTEARECLVNNLLPAVGTALLVGQFGMGKTSAALDLAASVITGGAFADLKIGRPGGVLWIAAEGQHDLSPRLKALEIDKNLAVGRFARVESCPPLLSEDAREILLATAKEAARQFTGQHGIALRLVIIDTVAAAAGWRDENSAAECQQVMNLLAHLARELQCCVVGVDHLGKTPDVGTRGNSAKEAAADVVLGILGDRDAAGGVKNLQLTVRKTRSGPTGAKIPFALRPVPLQGEESACVIDWQQPKPNDAAKAGNWPNSLTVFRRALGNALVGHGKPMLPWHDGPEVMAVDIAHVRREFNALYATPGETEKQRSDARRQAFHRYIRTAQQKGLIGAVEQNGAQWLWLPKGAP
jgi:AAA domain